MEFHEVVVSRAAAGASRESVVELARQIQDWVAKRPGFIRRTLVDAGDGTWIDLVVWRSPEDAQATMKEFATAPFAEAAASRLDASSMQMYHGSPVPLTAEVRS